MKRRTSDLAKTAAIKPLACPDCRSSLRPDGEDLVCEQGHRFMVIDGYYDLWPTDQPQPDMDWFATPYGLVYDTGIKERWLARLAGRLGWGADVGRMFDMMDEGVKCEPGEVVVDVPCGGAPALRSASGRLRGTYIGIDLSPEMLRRAVTERTTEGLDHVILARADALRMPLHDSSVDRLLCFNGLHVLPDKPAVMKEFHRVLKPGGQLFGNVVIADVTFGGNAHPTMVQSQLALLPSRRSPRARRARHRLRLQLGPGGPGLDDVFPGLAREGIVSGAPRSAAETHAEDERDPEESHADIGRQWRLGTGVRCSAGDLPVTWRHNRTNGAVYRQREGGHIRRRDGAG